MDKKMEERLESLKHSPKRKCTFADEGDREGYSYDIKDTDLAWMFQLILNQKLLIESQGRILEGFIYDIEDLKERLVAIRDNVKTAKETVCLDDHDEALYEANDSLNYIINSLLVDFEKELKQ